LTSLNLSLNSLKVEDAKNIAEAVKVTNCAIAVVLAPSDHWYPQDNGALTSLNLSSNYLQAEGAKIVADAL
jgi:hypothetical protein